MTFLALFLLFSQSAHSTITVTPVSPNSASSSIFYYAAAGAASPGGFIASGYNLFDLTKGLSSTTSTSHMILLDIKSTTDFTVGSTNQSLMLKFYANQSGTSNPFPFPIAAAGITTGVPPECSASNVYCNTIGPNSKYWMVSYPERQTIRVGIYPRDICYFVDWVANGGSSVGSKYAQGCNSESLVIAATDTSAAIEFTASIYVADTADAITDAEPVYTGATGGSEEVESATLNFQQTAPTYSCSSDFSNLYFPGDQGISLNGALFAATKATGGAPVNSIVVVAKKGSAALTAESTYLTNDLVRTASLGLSSYVSGFDNTTDGVDNKYNLAFSVQDASGFIASFNGGCTVANVQTSEIQTFLKTNRCFIASSAFRNPQAIPVLILREFRDQYLLKFGIGKAFVSWYYEHSPKVALWLWFHPEFRYPVILALSPLILFAIFLVHPQTIVVLILGLFALKWSKKEKEAKS